MTVARGRRQFLGGALLGVVGSALAPAALAVRPQRGLSWQTLHDGLFLVQGAGGNVLALQTLAGLVLVDGGEAHHAAGLQAALRSRFPRTPVALLFNTHWHPEQTGSNALLGRRGTPIMAHENTRLWLSTPFTADLQGRRQEPLPPQARPTRSFHNAGRLELGGQSIEYGPLPAAHTDGDIFLRFPAADVIAVGGALSASRYPQMDAATGGWLGGVVETCELLLSMMSPATRIVASDGGVLGRADVQAQHEMSGTLRTRIVDAMKQGLGVDDMLAQRLTQDFDAQWGDPASFLRSAYRGLWGHVRELGTI